VEPLAVRVDSGTFDLTVTLETGERTTGAVLTLDLRSAEPPRILLQGGTPTASIVLRDDGASGDSSAGDGVFTATDLSISWSGPARPVVDYEIRIFRFTLSTGDRTIRRDINEFLSVWVYAWDGDLVPPELDDVAPGVRATDHVVSIASEPLRGGFRAVAGLEDLQDVAREFFSHFADDRDFLIIIELFARSPAAAPCAGYGGVQNQVRGIGTGRSDETAAWGSAGRLQGVIHFRCAPSGTDYVTLIHEINHRWGVWLDESLGLGSVHWAPNLNRETTAFVHEEFNDLELYLAGWLPADSVSPPELGKDGTTIQDLVEIEGERVPDVGSSQRDFAAGVVVLLERPLTRTEMGVFEFWAGEFEKASSASFRRTFEQATGGRARITTSLVSPPASMDKQPEGE
jgi:hypothetical protein